MIERPEKNIQAKLTQHSVESTYLKYAHLLTHPIEIAITRRHCIQSLGLMALASATSPCLAAQLAIEYPWQALLGVSLADEHDYHAEIKGKIPTTLKGTLYRNGPGLFERASYRKLHILDGDGMIQAIDLRMTRLAIAITL